MPNALCPCPACQRHVRAEEPRCPFCDAALNASPIEATRVPRVSRALLVAAGAAMALSGCDAPWVSVAHADPMEEPVSMAPQYGAPPEFYDPPRRPRGADAGVNADAGAAPRPPRAAPSSSP